MTAFVKKSVFFLMKTVLIQNFKFCIFAISWSIFELYRLILPFWNSQSLFYNILLFRKYAMNDMTEIEENMWKLFFVPDLISKKQ